MSAPPYNFSWAVPGQLAGMACPSRIENLQFLVESNIGHLVTLSPEQPPAKGLVGGLGKSSIPVVEFEPPSLDQIRDFIRICKGCREKGQAVGVHCRMGRGRTGVMLACYMVHFLDYSPEKAISETRKLRPGSIETYSQERAVFSYRDWLRSDGFGRT